MGFCFRNGFANAQPFQMLKFALMALSRYLAAILTDMATKDQYEYFSQRFNDESERHRDLLKKSQLYFSVITVVSSVLFANISTFKDFILCNSQLKITTFVLLADLAVILVLLFLSIRVKDYELPINTEEYLENLPEDSEQKDTDFFDDRIADFIAAIDNNQEINNEKAEFLKYSEYAILIFIFLILVITLQILF